MVCEGQNAEAWVGELDREFRRYFQARFDARKNWLNGFWKCNRRIERRYPNNHCAGNGSATCCVVSRTPCTMLGATGLKTSVNGGEKALNCEGRSRSLLALFKKIN